MNHSRFTLSIHVKSEVLAFRVLSLALDNPIHSSDSVHPKRSLRFSDVALDSPIHFKSLHFLLYIPNRVIQPKRSSKSSNVALDSLIHSSDSVHPKRSS